MFAPGQAVLAALVDGMVSFDGAKPKYLTEDRAKLATGADLLDGSEGNDELRGGEGNDLLDGGLGADRLTGGTEEDTFRFSTALGGGNVDEIVDFNVADDIIFLARDIFEGVGAAGTLALLMIGLMAEFVTRNSASLSWGAGR